MADDSLKNINLTVPFPSTRQALIAYDILKVDKEIKGSNIKRHVTIRNKEVIINFEGTDPKRIRVAINSTFKNVLLIIKTLDQFGFG